MAHFEENRNQKQKSEFESEAEVRGRNQNQKSAAALVASSLTTCSGNNVLCERASLCAWCGDALVAAHPRQEALRTGIRVRYCVSCGQPNIVQWQQRAVRTGILVRLVGFCAGSGPSTRRRCARASVCAVMQDAPTDAGRPNNTGRPRRRSSTQ